MALRANAADSPFLLVDEAEVRGVTFLEKNFATKRKYPFETYRRSGDAAKAKEHAGNSNRLVREQKAQSLGVRGSKE